MSETITIDNVTMSKAMAKAAPDMLEALEVAAREMNAIRARDGSPQHIDWHRGQPMQTDSCAPEAWDEWTEQCFSAIAKARGET